MKFRHILFPLVLMATGCSNPEYSFRVDESAFEAGTLTTGGSIPGDPEGDEYEITGEVIVTPAGSLTFTNISQPNGITFVGRDLKQGEGPEAVLIRFDSRRIGNEQTPSTQFRIFDSQGEEGALITISNGNFWMPGTNGISEFPSSGGAIPFEGDEPHNVLIQINFHTKAGRLTISQGGHDASINFEVPQNFGVAKSMQVQVGDPGGSDVGHELIPPISATYTYLKD